MLFRSIWLTKMNPEYAAKLFPAPAAAAGLKTGVGTVECTIKHDGGLEPCAVVSEQPPGLGFGDAALQIAAVMKMNPWTAQGDPVDGARIRLPVRLELQTAPPAGPQPPAKP